MRGYDDVREHLTPLGLVRCFRRGAARNAAVTAGQVSRALAWYWQHFQIESIRMGSQVQTTVLCWAGLRRKTESAACEPPMCDGVESPNVKIRGAEPAVSAERPS